MGYHPKSIANILGISNVSDKDKYWIRYDYREIKNFIITCAEGGKETHLYRAPRGLHWLDTRANKSGEGVEVLINTLEDNKSSYTRCSYLRAKLARNLQRVICRPSIKTIKQIVGSNLCTNCPFNIVYISATEDIFVPDEGILCEKTSRTKPKEVKSMNVNLPTERIEKY